MSSSTWRCTFFLLLLQSFVLPRTAASTLLRPNEREFAQHRRDRMEQQVLLSGGASSDNVPFSKASAPRHILSKSRRRRRQLQSNTGLFSISTPDISTSGMQLQLRFTVRDFVQENMLRVELFRDVNTCQLPLPDDAGNYISVDLLNDATPIGSGSGTRSISVAYNINPVTVGGSPLVDFSNPDRTLVSFCSKVSLLDTTNNNQVANTVQLPIRLVVDIFDRLEILEVLQDQTASFGAEAYECDEDNNRLDNANIKNQGDRIKICVQPDAATLASGVAMRSINSFRLVRGDVSQDIIVPDGVIQDLQTTSYRCNPGQPVCSVDAPINNQFFYSRGLVFGQGIAWLQYSANVRKLTAEGLVTTTELRDVPVPVTFTPQQRQLQTPGEFIGGRPIEMSFEIEPSGSDWDALAFLCNGLNEELTGDILVKPDEDVRVCVSPSQEALQAGVYVREIATFYFEQESSGAVQFAVEATGRQAEDSLYICYPGTVLCVFKTRLSQDFFDQDGKVKGIGEIILQYGTESDTSTLITRRANIRNLQGNPSQIDAGFAGRAEVDFEFDTDNDFIPADGLTWQEKAERWWKDNPVFLRIVYVMAVILAFIIILCFSYAICCGVPCFTNRNDKKLDEEASKPKIVPPPVTRSTDRSVPVASPEAYMDDPEVGSHENDYPNDGFMALKEDEEVPQSPKKPGSQKSFASSKSPKKKSTAIPESNPEAPMPSAPRLLEDSGSVGKSPRSRKPTVGGDAASVGKSPRPVRRTVAGDASVGNSVGRSPKPVRKTMAGDASVGRSPKPVRKGMSGDASVSRSPKPVRKAVAGDASVGRSPKPTRKAVAGDASVGRSPKPVRKAVAGDASVGRSPKPTRKKSPKPGSKPKVTPQGELLEAKSPKSRRRAVAKDVDELKGASSVHSKGSKSPKGRRKAAAGNGETDKDLDEGSVHTQKSTRSGRRPNVVSPIKSPKGRKKAPGIVSPGGTMRSPVSGRKATLDGRGTPKSGRSPRRSPRPGKEAAAGETSDTPGPLPF